MSEKCCFCQVTYRINAILINIPNVFFVEFHKDEVRLSDIKSMDLSQLSCQRRINLEDSILSYFKFYYTPVIIKTV